MSTLRLLVLVAALALAPLAVQPASAEPLTVLLPSEFAHLDPVEILSGDQTMVMYHVYCRLYTFNDRMEPVPDLLLHESLSPDNRTWTLKLRPGARFEDGTPVNAEAVKYTIERMRRRGGSQRVLFQAISEVRTQGDDTVILTTEKPFPSLRNSLAHPNAGIVSPKADAELGDRYGVQPVSCGPYTFKEWTRGTRIVLDRNDAYYGRKAAFERITFQFVPDVTTRLLLVQRGQADIALRLGPIEAQQLKANSKVRLEKIEGRNVFFQLNMALAPTTDVRVRRALNHAVDKNAIIDKVLLGAGSPARSVLEAMIWGHEAIGTYAYDPAKAKELLKEAGASGAKIVLYSPDNRYLLDSQVSQAVAGYLRAVGLDVDLKVIGDWAGYVDAIKKRTFNAFMLGWGGSTGDPDQVLRSLFHSSRAGSLWNLGAYANKDVDGLIEQGSATFDTSRRKAIYADVQKRLFDDAPWIFLYRVTSFTAVGERVKEFHTLEGPEFHYVFPVTR